MKNWYNEGTILLIRVFGQHMQTYFVLEEFETYVLAVDLKRMAAPLPIQKTFFETNRDVAEMVEVLYND